MKTLNQKSTAIFARLMDTLDTNGYLKIRNEPFMPLTMELVDTGIATTYGIGNQYSLCHYYELNGDLMQDPEMCFIVVDKRTPESTDAGENLIVIPCMFQQANMGIYQQSISYANGGIAEVKEQLQAVHTEFANNWLHNLYIHRYVL